MGRGEKIQHFLVSLPTPSPAAFDLPYFLLSFGVSTWCFCEHKKKKKKKKKTHPKKTLSLQAKESKNIATYKGLQQHTEYT